MCLVSSACGADGRVEMLGRRRRLPVEQRISGAGDELDPLVEADSQASHVLQSLQALP